MARVCLVENDQAPSEVREMFQKVEGAGARVLNLYKAVANSPRVLRDFMRLGNALLARTELEPKLRELAVLRVAKLCGSEYEWTQHVPIALEMGASQEQIEAIAGWKESAVFSDIERAVLEYTDEVAQNVNVKEGTFAALQKHLSEQNIVELTLSVGYWGMVARVLVPLQIEVEAQSIGSAKDLLGKR